MPRFSGHTDDLQKPAHHDPPHPVLGVWTRFGFDPLSEGGRGAGISQYLLGKPMDVTRVVNQCLDISQKGLADVGVGFQATPDRLSGITFIAPVLFKGMPDCGEKGDVVRVDHAAPSPSGCQLSRHSFVMRRSLMAGPFLRRTV
jgi:hypothetical protein